jgi:iron complex transport system substrate-binding protein
MKRSSPARTALVALALLLIASLAACGDDGGTTASTGTTIASETTTAGGDATGGAPERIVSLSPTATEMLFAIGAGALVVAVDDQSNHPADAPVTDLSGYTPNVEAIAGYEPDLVVLSGDTDDVVAQLEALDIDTLILPAATALDDMYAQIEQLGAATGHIADAAAPLTYYHELDNTVYSVTSSTFIGALYSLAGLENIADPADSSSSGYPQLSAEFLVDADPDIIFLADTKCCGETAATFGARPGFDELSAVENGAVVELDDDIASRWGPRTADLLETIVDALENLPESAKAG